jgi:3-hydroxyacyl-[acyl-carrier-protein] dehydratase
MVVLRKAGNVKYGQFVQPGQTLQVTAEILNRNDEGETKIKAKGTMYGRLTVAARLTLKSYNLADTKPNRAETDEEIREEMRRQFGLLYNPEAVVEAEV